MAFDSFGTPGRVGMAVVGDERVNDREDCVIFGSGGVTGTFRRVRHVTGPIVQNYEVPSVIGLPFPSNSLKIRSDSLFLPIAEPRRLGAVPST